MKHDRGRRLIHWWTASTWRLAAVVVVLSAIASFVVRDLRPDYSVEHFFPTGSLARSDYERFQTAFPFEDAQALVVVSAPDLYTSEGLQRIGALELALEGLPHVDEVEGPRSIDDIRGDMGAIEIEPLFGEDLDAGDIARGRAIATTDPLFARRVADPDGTAMIIRVNLAPDAADNDRSRQEFYQAANELLRAHHAPHQSLLLTGQPAIRARFADMVGRDLAVLLPLSLAVALLLLFASYRHLGVVLAGTATIALSMLWSFAVFAALDYPITALSSILPMVVMIISISDSVHIINHYLGERASGGDHPHAARSALEDSAGPCLATEVVLACGFASLVFIDIEAIVQFGVGAAAAMLLTWLANVTVLPLGLALVRKPPRPPTHDSAPLLPRLLVRLVAAIEVAILRHPRVVVACVASILVVAGFFARDARMHAYVFDDLPVDSAFYRDLRRAEDVFGGLVSLAVHVRVVEDDGAENTLLEPEVLATLDRATEKLRSYPEVGQALSPASYLRKAHTVFTGEEGLPDTRELAAQEMVFLDDGELLREVLSHDRRDAAALAFATDMGTKRGQELLNDLQAWVDDEQKRLDDVDGLPRVELRLTGQLRVHKEVNDSLVGGLVGSFGSTVLVTLLIFCVVLRSWQLGLIGLIPNLSPMIITGAFMGLLDITLRPSTVVVFAVILVVADDDTLQFLSRLRGQYRRAQEEGAARPHEEAALRVLRETGTAMFMTSTVVSAGFLMLCISEFQGLEDLGLLIGITLFAALFADLFLTPILIMRFRPKLDDNAPRSQDPPPPDRIPQ